MREFFQSVETTFKLKRLLEFFVALVVVLVLTALVMALLGWRQGGFLDGTFQAASTDYRTPPLGGSSSGGVSYYEGEGTYYSTGDDAVGYGPGLSVRNVTEYVEGVSAGPDAPTTPDTDTRTYAAHFRTNDVARTCASIKELSAHEGTMLVHSSVSEEWCALRYQVERAAADAFVRELSLRNPERFTEERARIEETIRDFTGARTALENKQALLQETLERSTSAYDELIALATEHGDAEELGQAITGKLAYVERLTREQLSLEEELRALERRLAREVERVQYSFFDITVEPYPHLPLSELRESWATAMRELAVRTNSFVQGVTVGLVVVLLLLVQLALYIGIVFVVCRFVIERVRPHLGGLVQPSSTSTPKQHTVVRTKKPVA